MSKSSIVLLLLALALLPSLAADDELVGALTRETLFEKNPEWQAVAAAYQPKPDCVEKIRALALEVKVEIYLGT